MTIRSMRSERMNDTYYTSYFRRTLCAALLLAAGLVLAPGAYAQQFVYQPKNPAFGGSPYNYSWMLSSAEAQKDFEGETRSRFDRDPLEDFESGLQRQILSQLSRELVYDRFRDLDLTQEGRYDLGDFIVEVIPGLDGINVRVFNVLTGDETTIEIPNY